MINTHLYTQFKHNLNMCGYFETTPKIAIAVSGGIDSLTTALLAKKWCDEINADMVALIIDHGIRPEAASECTTTASWLQAHGIKSHILTYHGTLPKSNVMAAARDIRYQLLTDYCKQHDILHILTGHHADDQIETYLMRKERASSSWGFCAMSNISLHNHIRILRPLLNTPKEDCQLYLKSIGQDWIEDPTNSNTHYTRNRIRKEQQDKDNHTHLKHIAENQKQRSNQETYLYQWMSAYCTIYPQGFMTINATAFSTLDKEYALRTLKHALQCIGGNTQAIRIHELEQIHQSLSTKEADYKGGTLHGCKVEIIKEKINIYRELSHIHKQLAKNKTQHFDNRFQVQIDLKNTTDIYIDALGKSGWETVKNILPKQTLPPRILYTLPCVKIKEDKLETPVTIPHIGYNNTTHNIRMECVFIGTSPLAPLPFNWYV